MYFSCYRITPQGNYWPATWRRSWLPSWQTLWRNINVVGLLLRRSSWMNLWLHDLWGWEMPNLLLTRTLCFPFSIFECMLVMDFIDPVFICFSLGIRLRFQLIKLSGIKLCCSSNGLFVGKWFYGKLADVSDCSWTLRVREERVE